MMLGSLKIIILLSHAVFISCDEGRQLVFINGGPIKFVLGWVIPVSTHIPIAVLQKNNIQAAYPMITNATQLSDLFASGIQKGLRYSKNSFYSYLQRVLDQAEDGSQKCLQRLICELSETPIDSNGLLGDIIQYLFTPDKTVEQAYRDAWEDGRKDLDCDLTLPCPHISILNAITTLKYIA